MTRAEENIGQSTTAFEPSRNDQDGLIPRKKPTAKYDDGLLSEKSRGATGFELVSKPRSFLAPTCGRYPSSDVVATRSWTPEVAAQLPEWLGICRVQQNFPPRAIRESFETPVLNNIQESILGQDADSVRNNLLVARERPLLSAA
jgi:hypothetical protein